MEKVPFEITAASTALMSIAVVLATVGIHKPTVRTKAARGRSGYTPESMRLAAVFMSVVMAGITFAVLANGYGWWLGIVGGMMVAQSAIWCVSPLIPSSLHQSLGYYSAAFLPWGIAMLLGWLSYYEFLWMPPPIYFALTGCSSGLFGLSIWAAFRCR